MKTSARGLAAFVAAALCAACAHRGPPQPELRRPPPIPPQPGQVLPSLGRATHVYTLTNLHPDEERQVLYTANFQQPGLIPICSEVTLLRRGEDWLTFQVNATGKRYEYDSHEASAEPFIQNVERYFGPACPTAKLDALTQGEREAVRLGVVIAGMRKEAVVLAIGYPPRRDTPTLDRPMWTYWRSREHSFFVEFDASGVVLKTYN